MDNTQCPNHSKVSKPQQTFNYCSASHRHVRKSASGPVALQRDEIELKIALWLAGLWWSEGTLPHNFNHKCCYFNKQAQRGSQAAVLVGRFLRNQLLSVLNGFMYNSWHTEPRGWLAFCEWLIIGGRREFPPIFCQTALIASSFFHKVCRKIDDIYSL